MAVAIVLAGGNGSRMNSDVAKQYIMLDGKELLYYCLNTFERNSEVTHIVLVTRAEDIEFCQSNIVDKYGFKKVRSIVAGGKQRYDSVYQGLLAAREIFDDPENDIVIIHDGARPFVTDEMISESICEAKKTGACTVGVPVKDTIKIVDENMLGISTPDRNSLFQIQTPQTFLYKLIMEAYKRLHREQNVNITDDTTLLEQYLGVKSKVILGSYGNIKITTPEDLDMAEIIIKTFRKIIKTS
ncbi:MAG: 2-C-methyl-D-erythritol 4-phosphate cytidylyltransferase [Lachnospiraceae bacterium]|nr:2-C-methyl-D-erythritol 4-phosphate cytidylyltransferase [Lachnospiraceae bacterium]